MSETREGYQHRLTALYAHRRRAEDRGDRKVVEELTDRIKHVTEQMQELPDTDTTMRDSDWRQVMHRGRKG